MKKKKIDVKHEADQTSSKMKTKRKKKDKTPNTTNNEEMQSSIGRYMNTK